MDWRRGGNRDHLCSRLLHQAHEARIGVVIAEWLRITGAQCLS